MDDMQAACAGRDEPNYTNGFYLKWKSTLGFRRDAASRMIRVDIYRLAVMDDMQVHINEAWE